ncbi:MAG: FtsQ-type POTRA domain-containing protein [Clostridia bacterium]|nr:FtsQ-type POTRA domain-containing protein [Clostridia bacterium]
MQKKVWVILLTALIFLSVSILGISAACRVEQVNLNTSLVTAEARTQAEKLQARLNEAYDKDSLFFADDEKAKDILKEFPYFHIVSFEKSYPNRLIINVVEGAEVYALEKQAGEEYYILGADGTVLDIRSTFVNELNGEENVVIKGLNVSAENGEIPTGDGYFSSVLNLCEEISSALGGIRRNVTMVEVFARGPEPIFVVTMREGVKLYIGAPDVLTKEKVQKALGAYMGLSNQEKTFGRIAVSDKNGEILCSYSANDEFIG